MRHQLTDDYDDCDDDDYTDVECQSICVIDVF